MKYGVKVSYVLSRCRAERNVTQATLAEAVGVAGSTWCRIEAGKSALTVNQLEASARFLGTTPATLLARADALVVLVEPVERLSEPKSRKRKAKP